MSTTKKISEIAVLPTAPSFCLTIDSSGNIKRSEPKLLNQSLMKSPDAVDNIDELKKPGYYVLTDNSAGTFPHGSLTTYRWALVEVIQRGVNDIIQRLTDIDKIAVRRGSLLNNNWSIWREVILSDATSA